MALALSLSSIVHSAEQIGEEYIKPIEYPKYIFMGHFSNMRQGSLDKTLKAPLATNYGGSIGFDVGLYKYFNAGALLSLDTSGFSPNDLTYLHLTLFARPQITLFERLSIFARLGAGPSAMIGIPPSYFKTINEDLKKQINEKLNFPINMASAGIHGMATIGVEYFPFSRFGITAEWGILADYIWVRPTDQSYRIQSNERRLREDPNLPPEERIEIMEEIERMKSGRTYSFFLFEMPFMISLNIIL